MERKLANIGPRGVAKRRITGIMAGSLAVILTAILLASGWSIWWRLILFPILYTAIVGLLQAHGAT